MSIKFEIEKVSPRVNDEIDHETIILKVACPKRVDVESGNDLWVFLKTMIDGGTKKIIINMEDMMYIDSSGIGVIINTTKLIRSKNGEVILCNILPEVKEVFKVINLQNFIKIYKNEHEAIDSFRYIE